MVANPGRDAGGVGERMGVGAGVLRRKGGGHRPPVRASRGRGREEAWRAALTDDDFLASQLTSSDEWTGEQRLQIAVLLRAIADYSDSRPSVRTIRESAITWFTNDTMTFPHAFLRICESLNLEATRVRDRIRINPRPIPSGEGA